MRACLNEDFENVATDYELSRISGVRKKRAWLMLVLLTAKRDTQAAWEDTRNTIMSNHIISPGMILLHDQ